MTTVLQMTPIVFTSDWSALVEWMAQTFDMPVSARFDEQGWGRLAAESPGLTVLSAEIFEDSRKGHDSVVELEVYGIKSVLQTAISAGAELVTEPVEVLEGMWHAAITSPQGVLLWLWDSGGPDEDEGDVHDGPIDFTVSRRVSASPERAFDAVTRAADVEEFFVSNSSGDFDADETVTWTWEEYGDSDLEVVEFKPNEFVAFKWSAHRTGYRTRVQFSVRPGDDGGAEVAITESGWDADRRGMRSAFAHCEGWTSFLSNLRMYLDYDVSLMKE